MKNKINLEHLLAHKLGNRSIKPSENAWDRIASKREQGKSKKKRLLFKYSAASVILVLFSAGYLFFSNSEEVIMHPKVINSENVVLTKKTEDPIALPEDVPQIQSETIVVYKEVKKNINDFILPKEKIQLNPVFFKSPELTQYMPEIHAKTLESFKIYDKEKNYQDEVDYLLYNAIKQADTDKRFNAATNETALLKEVEEEMDDYYREKAMKFFSLQNKTIRFAVKEKH